MRTSIIVAYDENRLIGKNGALPWNIPDDLKLFKNRTMNHPVVMGRVTWDSLPKQPLWGRLNIIVSRIKTGFECLTKEKYGEKGFRSQLVYYQPDVKAAIKWATWCCPNNDELFIIGGQQIYVAALAENLVDKIYATEVEGDHEGDVYFPHLTSDWSRNVIEKREQFEVVEYERRQEINS